MECAGESGRELVYSEGQRLVGQDPKTLVKYKSKIYVFLLRFTCFIYNLGSLIELFVWPLQSRQLSKGNVVRSIGPLSNNLLFLMFFGLEEDRVNVLRLSLTITITMLQQTEFFMVCLVRFPAN